MSRSSKILILFVLLLAANTGARVIAQSVDTQFKLAAGYYERGQWNEAVESFQHVINQFPKTEQAIKAHFYKAETVMQQRDFESAYKQYRDFLKTFARHPLARRAMFRMGESALRAGNTSISLRMLEEFSRTYPDDELNRFSLPYLGQLRILRNEPQLAERIFEASLARHPNGPMASECQLGLGKAFLNQGFVTEAEQIFEFCINQDATIADRAKIQLGRCALLREPRDEALAERWFKTVANDASAPETRAEAMLSLATLWNQAARHRESFELLEPIVGRELPVGLKSKLLFEAAVSAAKIEELEQASQWLNQIRATTKDSAMVLASARFELKLLQLQGKGSDAIKLADKFNLVAEKRMLVAAAQENFGRDLYANNQFADSLSTFDDLLALEDVDPQRQMTWHYLRALNLIATKRFADAEKALNRISPEFADNSLNALTQFCFASVKFRQDKYAEAIPHYRRYLDQSIELNDLQAAKLEFAICLARTGQFAAVDKHLQLLLAAGEVSEHLEAVIEIVAEQASVKDHQDALKWYRWLSTLSQNDERKRRVTNRLITMGLEVPLDQQSVDGFAELFQQSPGDGRLIAAAVKRAVDFEKSGDLANSVALYQLVVANPNAQFRIVANATRIKLAQIYQRLGGRDNLALAKTHLKAWLGEQTAPVDESMTAEVLYQLAWVQRDLGDTSASESSFRRIVREYRDSKYWPDAAYRTVESMATNQNYQEAKTLVKDILSNENSPNEVVARACFLNGKIAVASKDWAAAKAAMTQAIPLLQDQATKNTAKYFLAESKFQRKNAQAATSEFASLHSKLLNQPAKYRPWIELRLATLFLNQNKATDATKIATDAFDRYPEFGSRHEFSFLIAQGLESRGLLNDARTEFEKVVSSPTGKTSETAAHAQWRIGETYFHQEKYKDAISAYYRVDSLYDYPKWRAAALLQAGKCQEHLLRPANAVKLYKLLLKKFPDSEFAAATERRLKNLDSTAAKTANKNSQPQY